MCSVVTELQHLAACLDQAVFCCHLVASEECLAWTSEESWTCEEFLPFEEFLPCEELLAFSYQETSFSE